MTQTYDITAYQFNADVYCPACVMRVLCETKDWPVPAPTVVDLIGVEEALDRLAMRENVDRENEASFDSGDFPKVVFAPDLDAEYCGACLEPM